MATEIAKRIEASKAKAALTPKERRANREAVKELAAKHMESSIKKLSEIVADKNAPASAKVAAASQLLDRVAGKPKFQDERETEQSQLERMGESELIAFICEGVSQLSTESRAAIAETIIATERGIHLDYKLMAEEAVKAEAEAESVSAGLPPLGKPKKE